MGTVSGYEINPHMNKCHGNYYVVRMSWLGATKTIPISRLFLLKKLGLREMEGKQAAHLDGNTLNNSVDNLAAMTHEEHAAFDARVNYLRKGKTKCARCGTVKGDVRKGSLTPDLPIRISGKRYGYDGYLCRRCYSSARYQNKKKMLH